MSDCTRFKANGFGSDCCLNCGRKVAEHNPDTDTNQASEGHVHYSGICKKEFNRGYAFGRKDSYDELLKTPGAKASTIFEDNSVIIKIPRKEYERLRIEVEKNK